MPELVFGEPSHIILNTRVDFAEAIPEKEKVANSLMNEMHSLIFAFRNFSKAFRTTKDEVLNSLIVELYIFRVPVSECSKFGTVQYAKTKLSHLRGLFVNRSHCKHTVVSSLLPLPSDKMSANRSSSSAGISSSFLDIRCVVVPLSIRPWEFSWQVPPTEISRTPYSGFPPWLCPLLSISEPWTCSRCMRRYLFHGLLGPQLSIQYYGRCWCVNRDDWQSICW